MKHNNKLNPSPNNNENIANMVVSAIQSSTGFPEESY